MQLLLGVDLRVDGHDWLLNRAAWFASRINATIDLVFVTEQSGHLERLTVMCAQLPKSVRGTPRIAPGVPEDVLVSLSQTYDGMVIGPREPGALERFLKGTMASRVMRRAHCPVLVPRGGGPGGAQLKVLLGVDVLGTEPGQVIAQAKPWIEKLGMVADALYVVSATMPPIKNAAVRQQVEKVFSASHAPEQDKLTTLLQMLSPEHRGVSRLRRGEAEDVLVELSSAYDLVIVGNRERVGFTRLLIGNVAHHVVRNAACDVLVMPTAQRED